jgi:hypothetical protein
MMRTDSTLTMFARNAALAALLASFAGCGSSKSTSSSPTGVTGGGSPTPSPTATPTATATPASTPTPAATCGLSLSNATFEPARVNCPAGSTTQTMRLVFDLSAGSGEPITINRVTTFGSRCQASGSTCTWTDRTMSFSPSVVAAGTRAQIVATTQFGCGSTGNPASGAQVSIEKLFVNTSCGAAREIAVTGTFVIGN